MNTAPAVAATEKPYTCPDCDSLCEPHDAEHVPHAIIATYDYWRCTNEDCCGCICDRCKEWFSCSEDGVCPRCAEGDDEDPPGTGFSFGGVAE